MPDMFFNPELPSMPQGLITTGPNTANTSTIDELCKLSSKLLKEKQEIDNGFRAALKKLIVDSKLPLHIWSYRFNLSEGILDEVMNQSHSIPEWVWAKVRKYVESYGRT